MKTFAKVTTVVLVVLFVAFVILFTWVEAKDAFVTMDMTIPNMLHVCGVMLLAIVGELTGVVVLTGGLLISAIVRKYPAPPH